MQLKDEDGCQEWKRELQEWFHGIFVTCRVFVNFETHYSLRLTAATIYPAISSFFAITGNYFSRSCSNLLFTKFPKISACLWNFCIYVNFWHTWKYSICPFGQSYKCSKILSKKWVSLTGRVSLCEISPKICDFLLFAILQFCRIELGINCATI